MRLKLDLKTRDWFIAMPQAGSPTGWSAWELFPRMEALALIERGFSFEYAEGSEAHKAA